ncbi:MAG: S8 family serine peptidase [Eubacterium sp.]|nr:S8 family serine peptidase [Eubacterium sp.]
MKLHGKKLLAFILSAVMIITTLLMPGTAFAKIGESDSKKKAEYVEGEVICVLNENATNSYMKAANTKSLYGKSFSQKDAFTFGKTKTVVLKSKTLSTEQMLTSLDKNSAVKYAIPNYIKHAYAITDDTYSEYQWALDNTGQNYGTAGLDTNADVLWADAAKSEEEQIVAIVDTGVDFTHPELKDHIWNNPYGKKLLGKHGMDFTGQIEDGEPLDNNGHGTHCAGIITAQADNQEGVSGINKSNVKIMGLKFLDSSGGGSLSMAIAAYDYLLRAVKLGANVVACNNSWGGYGDYEEMMLLDAIFDELGKEGVITFAAAGNEDSDITFNENEDPDEMLITTPACCQSKYCVTVAASNEKDELAGFSNYGKDVDVAAQGTDILSTVSYNCFTPTLYTAAQKSQLCAYMQDYDDAYAGEFGEFLPSEPISSTSVLSLLSSLPAGTDYEFSEVDGFGLDGKAMQIKFKDKQTKKKETYVYALEVPFTLANENDDYSISVMTKGNKGFEGAVYDVPSTATVNDCLMSRTEDLYLYGTEIGNYWAHKTVDIDIDPVDEDGEPLDTEYEKSTDRKLLFVFLTYADDTVVTIDDLAISKQGANADDFGKYDFYNGTSMATPYATGAAALIKNANPDASTLDIINMISNTGRYSAALEGKTRNAKVLSLDNIQNIPPMIESAAYNDSKQIEIKGSFRNITSVTVNGTAVTPAKTENGCITISDNNYDSKKLVIEVENAFGKDTLTTHLSTKPGFDKVALDMIPDTFSTIAIPSGEASYYVSGSGAVGILNKNLFAEEEGEAPYIYEDIGEIDLAKVYDGTSIVVSATLLNNSIYATVLHYISGTFNEDFVLGYEASFVRFDIEDMTTTVLTEVPDDALSGASLAVYNGEIYLIGGFDFTGNYECSSSVYKYNAKTKKFDKQAESLPEGRADTNFIQYKNKLIGIYGMNNDNTVPAILIYDGNSWKKSKVKLESDDPTTTATVGKYSIKTFEGNVGYAKGGIFANGPYIYGLGDSFVYNVDTDTVTACPNSSRTAFSDPRIIGTTCGENFVGFIDKSFDSFDNGDSGEAVGSLALAKGDGFDAQDLGSITGDSGENENVAYVYNTKAEYPTITFDEITNGYLNTPLEDSYMYGDVVEFKIASNPGYAVTSIKVNDSVVSTNSNSAKIVIKYATNNITNTSKLVASPITSLKVTKAGSKKCTLAWNKAKNGKGYQVQKYVDDSWKTVKTINNINTTSCSVDVKAGATVKYRVRAFGTFNKKTVYGSAKVKSIYVPKKQAVKSAKGAKGAMTVKYNKDAKATGYVIEYSANKNFKSKKSVTVNKNATVTKKIKAKSGKYFVRVRSYKTIDGKKIYGAYSAAKAVTVK